MAEEHGDILTSVVIVTYNSADEIVGCIDSFAGAAAIEVVVIDNDSQDGTPRILNDLKEAGRIDVLVLSQENEGFARAVNRGMAAARGRDILLLNPDARIAPADLERLRAAVDDDPNLGIVAPVVTSGPGVAVMSAGREPTLWPIFTHYSGLARAFPRVRALRGRHLYLGHHSDADQDVDWASGGCLYISRAAVERLGPLSERWFMYGEDIEYCHRAREAGLTVRVLSGARAQHAVGASVRASPSTTSTLWAENTFDYYRHTYSPGPVRRFAWRAIFGGGMYSRAMVSWLRARAGRGNREELLSRSSGFRRFAGAVWRRRTTRD